MKDQRNQKPGVHSGRHPNVVSGPDCQQVHTLFGGLNLTEVIECLQPRPGQSREPAVSPAARHTQVDGGLESQPGHTMFGGLDVKTLIESLRPQTDQPGESSANNHSAMQTPAPEIRFSTILTGSVIDSVLKIKKNKGVKESTLSTYRKRLLQFQRQFPWLPENSEPIIDYLAQFDGPTGRHRRNQQDLLVMLYEHAVKFFGLSHNPMVELERPLVSRNPIRTLTLTQLRTLMKSPQDLTKEGAAELLAGHGWRQVEVRTILAGDVFAISNGLIQVRGKERLEMTPVLPRTAALLTKLAEGLKPEDYLFVAQNTRGGKRVPLGEDGMRDLVKRLFKTAGLLDFAGHDLRRTFATLVRKSSGDEFLAMGLLRDRIPGVGSRYILVSDEELVEALQKHSPLSQLEKLGVKQTEFDVKKTKTRN